MQSNLMEILYQNKPKNLVRLNHHSTKIPNALNLVLFTGIFLINIYQFFIVPIVINYNMYYAFTLIPCLFFIPTTGVIVHEAIHNLMHTNLKINRFMGRVMAVFVGISFDLQRIDHLKHHVYNRTEKNCDEVYNPQLMSLPKATFHYFYNNIIGVYWHDFFLTLIICHFPQRTIFTIMSYVYGKKISSSTDSVLNSVINTNKLPALRLEGMALLLLLVLSSYLYGKYLAILIGLYILRALILAGLDSFAHYDTPLNDVLFAKNIKLPKLIEKFIFMNFNNHGVHHIFPTVSWWFLPNYKQFFAPNFYFITHGSIWNAIRKKYSKPFPLVSFPTKIVLNFRNSLNV